MSNDQEVRRPCGHCWCGAWKNGQSCQPAQEGTSKRLCEACLMIYSLQACEQCGLFLCVPCQTGVACISARQYGSTSTTTTPFFSECNDCEGPLNGEWQRACNECNAFSLCQLCYPVHTCLLPTHLWEPSDWYETSYLSLEVLRYQECFSLIPHVRHLIQRETHTHTHTHTRTHTDTHTHAHYI